MAGRQINKKTRVGDFAESLVTEVLSKRGTVCVSDDEFDPFKDIWFNGKSVEIKARTRIFKYPYPDTFAIEPSQWKKIDDVDITIFVNIPCTEFDYIHMYWLKDKSAWSLGSFPDKEKSRFYHISKMDRIYTIKHFPIIKMFYDLNFSTYKK
jgi:hypothetical protein